jgi:hypothetical protein
MLKNFLQHKRYKNAFALGSIAGLMIACFFLSGGDDLYRYYLPFAKGCLDCGFVPYHSQFFLSILLFFPHYPLTWPFWTIFTIFTFLVLLRYTKVPAGLLFLSFPFLGQIWLGQIDWLIALGLSIFVFAKNPYWRGVGIMLALIKPQLTFLALLLAFFLEHPKTLIKLSIVPVIFLLTSFIIYGIEWPLHWLSNAFSNLPVHVWRMASADIWKFGLALIFVPLFFKNRQERVQSGLLVSSLATPFFGVYSYVIFLTFGFPKWAFPLSFSWLLLYPFHQEYAMRFAWILPLSLLAWMIWQKYKHITTHSPQKQFFSEPESPLSHPDTLHANKPQ